MEYITKLSQAAITGKKFQNIVGGCRCCLIIGICVAQILFKDKMSNRYRSYSCIGAVVDIKFPHTLDNYA